MTFVVGIGRKCHKINRSISVHLEIVITVKGQIVFGTHLPIGNVSSYNVMYLFVVDTHRLVARISGISVVTV